MLLNTQYRVAKKAVAGSTMPKEIGIVDIGLLSFLYYQINGYTAKKVMALSFEKRASRKNKLVKSSF